MKIKTVFTVDELNRTLHKLTSLMSSASELFRMTYDLGEYDTSLVNYQSCRRELKRIYDLLPTMGLSVDDTNKYLDLYNYYYYNITLDDDCEAYEYEADVQ